MNILHINCNYVGTALHKVMIRHLDAHVKRNTVFAPIYDQTAADRFDVDENEIVSVCFKKWDRLFFYKKQAKIITAIKRCCDIHEYDFLHAYTLFTDGNCAFELSKEYGVAYAVAVRSTDLNVFLKYMPMLRRRGMDILEGASAIFFLSEQYRSELLEKYVPEEQRKQFYEKSFVIPNGLDDFWLENIAPSKSAERLSEIRKKKLRVITVGKVNRNKNQLAVAKAANLLNDRGYTVAVTVVGAVQSKVVLRRLRRYKAVTYHAAMPKEELLYLYRDSDICVLPSHEETFGLVYAEAMSQGLPVLYTAGQGFDGQFADGEAGHAVDARSVKDVAKNMQSLCEKYEQISERNPVLAERFRWDSIVKKYAAIYKTIVGVGKAEGKD